MGRRLILCDPSNVATVARCQLIANHSLWEEGKIWALSAVCTMRSLRKVGASNSIRCPDRQRGSRMCSRQRSEFAACALVSEFQGGQLRVQPQAPVGKQGEGSGCGGRTQQGVHHVFAQELRAERGLRSDGGHGRGGDCLTALHVLAPHLGVAAAAPHRRLRLHPNRTADQPLRKQSRCQSESHNTSSPAPSSSTIPYRGRCLSAIARVQCLLVVSHEKRVAVK